MSVIVVFYSEQVLFVDMVSLVFFDLTSSEKIARVAFMVQAIYNAYTIYPLCVSSSPSPFQATSIDFLEHLTILQPLFVMAPIYFKTLREA